jgi:nucleoside 2-deoxyribosyltransferase
MKYILDMENLHKKRMTMEKFLKPQWKLKCYLAGYSEFLEYRQTIKRKYKNKIIIVDPMTIKFEDINKNLSESTKDIWVVRRDKKLIEECDILIAKIEYLPKGKMTVGTIMEIMYAHERGIPVFLISSEEKIRKDIWLKFHCRKTFIDIEDCFDYILFSL